MMVVPCDEQTTTSNTTTAITTTSSTASATTTEEATTSTSSSTTAEAITTSTSAVDTTTNTDAPETTSAAPVFVTTAAPVTTTTTEATTTTTTLAPVTTTTTTSTTISTTSSPESEPETTSTAAATTSPTAIVGSESSNNNNVSDETGEEESDSVETVETSATLTTSTATTTTPSAADVAVDTDAGISTTAIPSSLDPSNGSDENNQQVGNEANQNNDTLLPSMSPKSFYSCDTTNNINKNNILLNITYDYELHLATDIMEMESNSNQKETAMELLEHQIAMDIASASGLIDCSSSSGDTRRLQAWEVDGEVMGVMGIKKRRFLRKDRSVEVDAAHNNDNGEVVAVGSEPRDQSLGDQCKSVFMWLNERRFSNHYNCLQWAER